MKLTFFLLAALGLAGAHGAPVLRTQVLAQNVCDDKQDIRDCALVRRGSNGEDMLSDMASFIEAEEKARSDVIKERERARRANRTEAQRLRDAVKSQARRQAQAATQGKPYKIRKVFPNLQDADASISHQGEITADKAASPQPINPGPSARMGHPGEMNADKPASPEPIDPDASISHQGEITADKPASPEPIDPDASISHQGEITADKAASLQPINPGLPPQQVGSSLTRDVNPVREDGVWYNVSHRAKIWPARDRLQQTAPRE